ncbi:uncharacterized protein LOC119304212 [Triticum dicoccoides]|uniref:uncharacterized protein LOC119304212 n=1 Tax=Triticum dicoccoides TaxID=85692 RepID=UPI00188DCA6A|nr:uncharacterized protein LOC119304212 [Triticum dicoccoides]
MESALHPDPTGASPSSGDDLTREPQRRFPFPVRRRCHRLVLSPARVNPLVGCVAVFSTLRWTELGRSPPEPAGTSPAKPSRASATPRSLFLSGASEKKEREERERSQTLPSATRATIPTTVHVDKWKHTYGTKSAFPRSEGVFLLNALSV